MSHLDEGTLHALLDGELETHEVAEIQAHLGSCSSCGLRLREVKEFLAEADRLIASVDLAAMPAGAASRPTPIPSAPSPARAEPEVRHEPPPRPQPPAAAPAKWEPWNEPPPVLLVPDNESMRERRIRRMRRFGWAAIITVIAGAGWVEARKIMPVSPDEAAPSVVSNRDAKDATVAPEETTPGPDQAVAGALAKTDSSPVPARKRVLAMPPTPAPTPPPATREEKEEPLAETTPTMSRQDSAVPDQAAVDKLADSGQDKDEPDSAANADLAVVRARASEALADLDRERRRNQAAAATAALDAQRRRAAAASAQPSAAPARIQPAIVPPPAPPTLEQRAQIYLRIGLDEAARQLGGPAHVIEGLSPLFMGLVQGGAVAGADGTRPVVRVVYQDSQGRLILLDQQRLRAGQATPAAGPLSWTIGGTAMWLNGEAAPDILRTYRPRVR